MSFKNEKIVETKSCQKCQVSFDVTDKDLEFYDRVSPIFNGEKYSIPTPKLCPGCREQSRLAWVNQLNLYNVSCQGCGQSTIARFSSDKKRKVYCNKCWSSDSWDALDYGQDIDFSRPIFPQIQEIMDRVPFQNLIGSLSNIENNAVYTNYTADISDSYMVTESDGVEQCYYAKGLRKSNNVIDCLMCAKGEDIYECIDCYDVYKMYYAYNSTGCHNSMFLQNCHGCSFCIGCSNLNNKQYYIFNKAVSPKEYEQFIQKLKSKKQFDDVRLKFREISSESIFKPHMNIGSQDCLGDNITHSNDSKLCFDVLNCENVKYCSDVNNSQDMMDISAYGSKSSLMYQGVSVGRYSSNVLFSATIGRGEDLLYCIDTKKSQHCFGCVNLKGGKYCILNKQYSQQEYESLLPKIIEHMKTTGEWGEFFPASMSPFGYNETLANEYFPGQEGEIKQGGFNWSDYRPPFPKVDKTILASQIPDSILDVPDDILNWAIECELTKKPFKIISQELKFYRKHSLPVPRRHPDQRHLDRMNLRNPRKLFERDCDSCSIEIQTTYGPERVEKVYCEECYNKEIY
ncbi:hypothetical protein OAN96_01065 [Candidatus Gracilibacteria bacterium]|nr:hypothetical protein [Candidatus Gracilibacteria bacterium]